MNLIIKQLTLGLSLLVVAMTASAGVITQSGVGATNVDQFAGTSHDLYFTLGLGEVITDVNVTVNMDQKPGNSFSGVWGDLDISIESNGIVVDLLSQSTLNDCCDFGDFNVTFDDDASATIASVSIANLNHVSGTFLPEFGSLSAFNGTALTSLWTLSISEVFCCENESDLTSWSVTVTTAQVPEPSAIALIGAGLVGIRLSRRRRKAVPFKPHFKVRRVSG